MTSENLPASINLSNPTLEISTPDDPHADGTFKALQTNDLHHHNNLLRVLYAFIPQATSISAITRLVDTVNNTLEKRRNHLFPPNSKDSNNWLDPI